MNTFLKVAIGIGAAFVSVWVWILTFFPITIIVATTAAADRLPAYSFLLAILAVAFGVVFGVCFAAKTLISKM